VNIFLNISSFSVILLVLGCPERSSSLTYASCKVNAIHKPLSSLKNVLQKPHEAFHAKLDAYTLLNFAIHHRRNETRS
jgi:hypothetical protein